MAVCQDSFDCPERQECYNNVPWSDVPSFCDCSSWYGFRGTDCTGLTAQIHLTRFFLAVQLFSSFILLILYARKAYWYINWKVEVKKTRLPKNKFSLKSSLLPVRILIFGIISVLCLFLGFCFQIRPYFDATQYEKLEVPGFTDSDIEVVAVNSGIGTGLISLGAVFYVQSALQISLHWLSVCDSVSYVFDSKLPFKKSIEPMKFLVRFVQVNFLLIGVILFFTNQFAAIGIMTGIIGLIFGTFLLIGRIRFGALFSDLPSAQDSRAPLKRTMKFVTLSTNITLPLILMSIPFFLLHSIWTPEWKDRVAVGSFNYVRFFRDLGVFSGLLLLLFNLWYANRVLDNLFINYQRQKSITQSMIDSQYKVKKSMSSVNARARENSDAATSVAESETRRSSLFSRGSGRTVDTTSRDRTLSGSVKFPKKTLKQGKKTTNKQPFTVIYDLEDDPQPNSPKPSIAINSSEEGSDSRLFNSDRKQSTRLLRQIIEERKKTQPAKSLSESDRNPSEGRVIPQTEDSL